MSVKLDTVSSFVTNYFLKHLVGGVFFRNFAVEL